MFPGDGHRCDSESDDDDFNDGDDYDDKKNYDDDDDDGHLCSKSTA